MAAFILIDVPLSFLSTANSVGTLALARAPDSLSVFEKPQRDARGDCAGAQTRVSYASRAARRGFASQQRTGWTYETIIAYNIKVLETPVQRPEG